MLSLKISHLMQFTHNTAGHQPSNAQPQCLFVKDVPEQIIMSQRSINFYLVINILNIVDVIIKCTHNSGSTLFDLATLVIIIISAHHGVSEEGVFTDVSRIVQLYLRMFPNPVIVANEG